MALEARIDGGSALRVLTSKMRAEGNKDLSRAMGRALGRAVEPVKASIDREAGETMPSGYKELLTGSIRHRISRRQGGQQARVILTTYADGKKERRDIRSLNDGKLRHPLWGDRDKWYITKIRAGFHDRGTEKAADASRDAMIEVVEDFAARLVS